MKYAKSIPQVILNYQICRGVAVIPKTEKLDHLTENFNITDFELLDEDKNEFEKLDRGGKLRVYQLKNTPMWKGEDPLCWDFVILFCLNYKFDEFLKNGNDGLMMVL